MGVVFSVKTINGHLRVISPLDSEHHVSFSLGKDWLLSNKFVSMIKVSIIGCSFLDLIKTIVTLFVGLEDIDFINFINQDAGISIILIEDL
jgi:hypothetical protein